MDNNMRTFLEALFHEADGQIALNYKQHTGMDTEWFAVDNISGLVVRATELSNRGHDVYFGCAPRYKGKAISGRGTRDDICRLSALWLDIDCKNPAAHKQQALPENIDTALAFLGQLPLPPSIVVSSGNGLHAYWLLTEPIGIFDQRSRQMAASLLKEWERHVQKVAKDNHGWKFDSVSDLPRILRVPGTRNFKSNPSKQVEVLTFYTDRRYPVQAFSGYQEKNHQNKAANDNSSNKGAEFSEMKARCAWIRHYTDNQDEQSEPIWKQLINLASYTKDAARVVHEISKDHPGYNPAETTRKLEETVRNSPGPTTCNFIANKLGDGEHCRKCPFKDKIRSPVTLGAVNPIYNEYVYVVDINCFFRINDGSMLSKESFSDLFRHTSLGNNPSLTVLRSPLLTKAESKTYVPGLPLYIKQSNGMVVNTWTPSGVTPAEGDASPFVDHIKYLFPDPIEHGHILDYLAYLVQHPNKKIRHVLMLGGTQGNGKSFIGQTMALVLGKRNTGSVDAVELHSSFNAWADQKQLLIIEELMHGGRLELNNKLKTLISEDTFMINQKYIPTYSAPTPRGILALTNHRVPIFLEQSDRRYFFVYSELNARERAYYDELWAWMASNPGVVLHYLLNRDLSSFSASKPPPATRAREVAITGSIPPLEAEIRYMLDERSPPFHKDLVARSEIQAALQQNGHRVTQQRVDEILKKIGFPLGPVRAEGRRPRLYAIRNAEHWEQATDKDREREFLRNSYDLTG